MVIPGPVTGYNEKMPDYDVLPLMEPSGHQLHIDPSGRAGYKTIGNPSHQHASLSGAAPRYSHPAETPGMGGSIPAAKEQHRVQTRKPTPDELMAMAKTMEKQMQAQHAAQMAMGPAVGSPAAGTSLDRGVPPWLQDYMAKEAQNPPAHGPYNPPQRAVDMTPEEKERYGAYRPF